MPDVAVEEWDPNLRIRRAQAVAIPSVPMLDGLRAAIVALKNGDGSAAVLDCVVWENTTDAVINIGGQNVDPRSLWVLAHVAPGGAADPSGTADDADPIADTIFELKSMGCATQGTTTKHPTDAGGVAHPISYSTATPLSVAVQVTISKRYNFPTDGAEQIVQAIATWAAGTNATTKKPNLQIGGDDKGELSWTDVLASFLNAVPGFDFKAIKFSTDGGSTWGFPNTNLVIPFGDFASIVAADVAVILT